MPCIAARRRCAGRDLAQPARRAARRAAAAGARTSPWPSRAARVPGPIVETRSLRSVLPADVVARLGFGTSPDGTPVGPDDFAIREGTSFAIDVPASEYVAELHVDAELGRDREAVVRVMVADTATGPARAPGQRVFLGDPRAGLSHLPCRHRRVPRADAAELARRGEPGRQGSGAGAVRQHLQQPRARRLRHDGQVPAHRRLLHAQHRRRQAIAPASIRRGPTCSDRGRTTTPTSACCSTTSA